MSTCSVRWRSSGGRGEFEFVPADSLEGREIQLFFEPLGLAIPAEVRGVKAQGKPRLRKFEPNNRQKLHLPQLVMAVARLPEPAREDHHEPLVFPLENKTFVMDAMDFDVIEDDGLQVTLAPLRVSILHSNFTVDLQDRLAAIAKDISELDEIGAKQPKIAAAISAHKDQIYAATNSADIRNAANKYIAAQADLFGMTNAGSASEIIKAALLPETEIEEGLTGKEGRILTRIHSYKERDRAFAAMAKKHYKAKNGGKLHCVGCGLQPETLYDTLGERCIEGHHTIPIEELQPDSITRVEDMAMVCASCHRIIHSRKPCLTIEELKALKPQGA